jgi:hypothetical protein
LASLDCEGAKVINDHNYPASPIATCRTWVETRDTPSLICCGI